jgi:GNAT superfamily N-acetyltransferase
MAATRSLVVPAGVEVRRRRPEDSEALLSMYQEIFGAEETEASRRRWHWQYQENPYRPPEGPEIWVACEGETLLGQYATMPVRLKVAERTLRASWGMDVMVKPGIQRKGIGSRLFLYWDRQVEASLGLGLSPSSYALFRKLQWQDVGPVPCYTRLLDVRALLARRLGGFVASLLAPAARFVLALAFPARRSASAEAGVRVQPLSGGFGPAFDRLWERAAPGFDFVVERSARYLEWKYRQVPFVSYEVFQAVAGDELSGYLVLRVAERPPLRLGLIVDLFAHPEDQASLAALVDQAVRWGRERRVARLQAFALDRRLGAALRRQGFFEIGSPMQFCLKINRDVDKDFYRDTSRWHVTFGDSDQDRHA